MVYQASHIDKLKLIDYVFDEGLNRAKISETGNVSNSDQEKGLKLV